MSINNFLANFKGGGYRPNRFKIAIDGIDNKLEFMCRSANIPSSDIGVIDIPYQGLVIPVPGDRPGGRTWDIEVFADTDFLVRDQLELWQESIRPQEIPGGVDVIGAFRTANIDLLSTSGETLRSYRILRCWPSIIGEMALAQETTDTIATYPVTLTFTSWTTLV